MRAQRIKNMLLLFAVFLLVCCHSNVKGQRLKYSSKNVFVSNPDNLQLVADVDGNHHLLSFSKNEKPLLFIFDSTLGYKAKIELPFKLPEKSSVQIIRFNKFYYLHIHPRLTQQHFLWKINASGTCIDFNVPFKSLLSSQAPNVKIGFQLIAYKNTLLMTYHTALDNIEKRTLVIVETDSMLHAIHANKVTYNFKVDEEKLEKEILVFGKYLLVLKTGRSSTALELMKINLATSYALSNTFSSSGYFYSQPALAINNSDSSFTVSALLTEPRTTFNPKQFVFVSRVNKFLVEEVPFAILRKQFRRNTGTNFLLAGQQFDWAPYRIRGEHNTNSTANSAAAFYRDLGQSQADADAAKDMNRLLHQTESAGSGSSSWEGYRGIRFSLLGNDLKIIDDSLVVNTKDSYTLRGDQHIRFKCGKNEYLLLAQQFVKRSRGLLLVSTSDENRIKYTDLRIVDRNDYLLTKTQVVGGKSIVIPYIHKLEAGLVKIAIN